MDYNVSTRSWVPNSPADLAGRSGDLLFQPVEVGRGAALNRHFEDLGDLVLMVAPHELLDGLGVGLKRLDQEQRFVLPLQLIVPVVKGMDGGDHRAASREVLDDERLPDSLGVVASSRRD